ncbi:taxadiene 5-alpha hydroxylase [Heracleum sosnowskyi]|uniref:Taxadiene 5-alpha hydroxylase n=1 Tax=Heracleum sosnowskyi TaxID=360622 RepID=A0AAD8IJK3_9APIA|nr:taxadiene 5-alpha hydroxylase [Heracleum sosnowskyi]
MALIVTTLFFAIFPIFFILFIRRRRERSLRLPPGSLGIPFIGQSLTLLRKMKANTADKWLQQRVEKYGPVSKLSLFGSPTVFIQGQAANKFIFTTDTKIISNQQTASIKMILGECNLFELSSEDHKRVRSALVPFLKPESLKRYVGKMDTEFRNHLQMHWEGKDQVTVLPLMKTLTFNIICSLLFGLESGPRREKLIWLFEQMMEGMWSIPINLPFTNYNKSLRASTEVKNIVKQLVSEKRIDLELKGASYNQDIITSLLSVRDENNKEILSENEIVHNVMLIMVAGHDTSAIVITFIIRLLATNGTVYKAVLEEQEDVRKDKPLGEILTWDDLAKMKYTWRVAMEVLRTIPPVFGGFRKAVKDIEYGGYLIPKGWQIFWATNMTHMDSNIFEEPTKFEPSRFENQSSIPPYCFIPFGGGARVCPGYEFARIEILVAIHYLVTEFTWELGCSDNSYRRDPLPNPAQGLPVKLISNKV